jgi:hypothetical protein
MMPMIATTISSSIRVKPLAFLNLIRLSLTKLAGYTPSRSNLNAKAQQ